MNYPLRKHYLDELKTHQHNPEEHAKIFGEIAKLYLARITKYRGQSFVIDYHVKVLCIYNYQLSLVRDTKQKKTIVKQIYWLYKDLFYNVDINIQTTFRKFKSATYYRKKRLETIRNDIRNKMHNIHNIHKHSRYVYSYTNKKMMNFIRYVFNESLNLYNKCLPIYAILCFGSTARKESTPYSDLEFAILIESEEHKEFFVKLAYIMYFNIVNLGESLVSRIGINSLEWFYDNITPYGLSFDPNTENASKNPIGNKKKKHEFIGTVRQFMDKINNLSNDDKNYQLLLTARYVTGDIKLFNKFITNVKIRHIDALNIAKKDLNKFAPTVENQSTINIKKELLRPLCILIEDLYFVTVPKNKELKQSSHNRVNYLKENKIISNGLAKNLIWTLNVLLHQRLKMHCYHGKQYDIIKNPSERQKYILTLCRNNINKLHMRAQFVISNQ